jgi:two-component system sensor histidine kinase KdpD
MQTAKVRWPAIGIWLVAWGLLIELDGTFNLANLALLLVLASAMAGMFLSAISSLLLSAVSVLLFNWFFIEPRHTFAVHLHQDVLLLVSMVGVNTVVSYLMARLRIAAELETAHALAAEQMHQWHESLREATDTASQAQLLQNFLEQKTKHDASVLLDEPPLFIGNAKAQDQQGLRACMQQFAALGPGSGRHENQTTLFLPIRGQARALGAVAIHRHTLQPVSAQTLQQLQQACDLLGLEIERAQSVQLAQLAKQDAQSQSLRNTLLTSISHDYRTPLANLMGAASAIHDQSNRLSTEKIQALANTVISEAQHLHRMTTNTLQLARLDAAPLQIKKDWESLQELLGSVLAKARQRFPTRDIVVEMPEALPLIHCDATLLVQLFDNLLENAVKYSPDHTAIEIQVQHHASALEIRVIDGGAGISDAWKTKVFQPFERVHDHVAQADASPEHALRRGMGVGLAVCQAIAKVHSAKIWVEDHSPQGTELCLSMPLLPQPDMQLKEV